MVESWIMREKVIAMDGQYVLPTKQESQEKKKKQLSTQTKETASTTSTESSTTKTSTQIPPGDDINVEKILRRSTTKTTSKGSSQSSQPTQSTTQQRPDKNVVYQRIIRIIASPPAIPDWAVEGKVVGTVYNPQTGQLSVTTTTAGKKFEEEYVQQLVEQVKKETGKENVYINKEKDKVRIVVPLTEKDRQTAEKLIRESMKSVDPMFQIKKIEYDKKSGKFVGEALARGSIDVPIEVPSGLSPEEISSNEKYKSELKKYLEQQGIVPKNIKFTVKDGKLYASVSGWVPYTIEVDKLEYEAPAYTPETKVFTFKTPRIEVARVEPSQYYKGYEEYYRGKRYERAFLGLPSSKVVKEMHKQSPIPTHTTMTFFEMKQRSESGPPLKEMLTHLETQTKRFLESLWNQGFGYTLRKYLGYTVSPSEYETKKVVISPGVVKAFESLSPVAALNQQTVPQVRGGKIEASIMVPKSPVTLGKHLAGGFISGVAGIVDLPIMVYRSIREPEYRKQVIQGFKNIPSAFLTNPLGTSLELVGSFAGGKVGYDIYGKLPARPRTTYAQVGKAKAVSFGIQTQRGGYTDYRPILTIGKGFNKVTSRYPKIKDFSSVIPEEGYLPKSPFETKIIQKSLQELSPREALKIHYARQARSITSRINLGPREVKNIMYDVLKKHGLPEDVADDIIKAIKQERGYMYGSFVQRASSKVVGHPTLARVPRDFDVAVPNPQRFAQRVVEMINKKVGKPVVELKGTSVVSKISGEKLFDIHSTQTPTSYLHVGESYLGYGLKPQGFVKTQEGLKTITLSEQVSRKLRGAMLLRPKQTTLQTVSGKVHGYLVPEKPGRIKDIIDYYIGEKALIEFLKAQGKIKEAQKASQALESWLNQWEPHVASAARQVYTSLLSRGDITHKVALLTPEEAAKMSAQLAAKQAALTSGAYTTSIARSIEPTLTVPRANYYTPVSQTGTALYYPTLADAYRVKLPNLQSYTKLTVTRALEPSYPQITQENYLVKIPKAKTYTPVVSETYEVKPIKPKQYVPTYKPKYTPSDIVSKLYKPREYKYQLKPSNIPTYKPPKYRPLEKLIYKPQIYKPKQYTPQTYIPRYRPPTYRPPAYKPVAYTPRPIPPGVFPVYPGYTPYVPPVKPKTPVPPRAEEKKKKKKRRSVISAAKWKLWVGYIPFLEKGYEGLTFSQKNPKKIKRESYKSILNEPDKT